MRYPLSCIYSFNTMVFHMYDLIVFINKTSSSAMTERPRDLDDFKWVSGWVNSRLNFRLKGYVSGHIYGPLNRGMATLQLCCRKLLHKETGQILFD